MPFRYSDLQSSKKRPVLVLTAPDRHGDFIALAVTSVSGQAHAKEIAAGALAAGALPKSSWVRFDKVFTLGEGVILRSFGSVTAEFLRGVLDGLCEHIGFAKP